MWTNVKMEAPTAKRMIGVRLVSSAIFLLGRSQQTAEATGQLVSVTQKKMSIPLFLPSLYFK